MASWMAHLRVADKLLADRMSALIGDLPQKHFIVGNIAPDAGEPNEDWTIFTPPTEISHWKLTGVPRAERAERFRETYLDAAQEPDAAAFYIGYYTHLLTDYIWSREIHLPCLERYATEFSRDPGFIWQLKGDWYDLDHLYLREHPDFRAFAILDAVTAFPNVYLDYFSKAAFEKKIAYITGFYKGFDGNLDREYPYMKKAEMDEFVETAAGEIAGKIKGNFLC
ncbi:MAG: zinc dependent phospholipase C family protein [Oscillospiraceae bacterium]|nr:zinc dependent phospholipase C family protein [Oscillospiraceae bacterium]